MSWASRIVHFIGDDGPLYAIGSVLERLAKKGTQLYHRSLQPIRLLCRPCTYERNPDFTQHGSTQSNHRATYRRLECPDAKRNCANGLCNPARPCLLASQRSSTVGRTPCTLCHKNIVLSDLRSLHSRFRSRSQFLIFGQGPSAFARTRLISAF